MKTKDIYKELGITYSFYSRFVKRFLDFSIALVALLILSPIFILVYLINLISVGFPAIYKQYRPGKDHKVFCIYKFRSMNNKKDKDGNLLPDQMRITTWGKIMRKTSLDELPQLINILKGDMSIVGPRPRLVKDTMFYDKDIFPYYIVRPGLTGPTQTTGRNANTWEQVFEKDIEYDKNITFLGDVKILFKTFISIFKSTGESHSNSEEDKAKSKDQEYYYADYIRRIQKISDEQYFYGLELSKQTILNKGKLVYHPELHDQELFDEMMKTKKDNKNEQE